MSNFQYLNVESPLDRLDYVYIDGKLGLSFSKLQTLVSCPRKFQLQEMAERGEKETSVAASWGHLFAAGVQLLWATDSFERAVVGMAAYWPFTEDTEESKTKRSLQTATYALEVYYRRYYPIHQEDWEFFPASPNNELFFLMHISDQFFYQGHIDLILRHKTTNTIGVWEIKTTTWNLHEADWSNSDQTGGYRIILEKVARTHGLAGAHPEVNYMILNPYKIFEPEEENGFIFYQFPKGRKEVVHFLQNLFTDLQTIQLYQKEQHFPTRGSSCKAFGRVCDFYGSCKMQSMISMMQAAGPNGSLYAERKLEDVDCVVEIDEILEYLEE